jgi:hypothetical protein
MNTNKNTNNKHIKSNMIKSKKPRVIVQYLDEDSAEEAEDESETSDSESEYYSDSDPESDFDERKNSGEEKGVMSFDEEESDAEERESEEFVQGFLDGLLQKKRGRVTFMQREDEEVETEDSGSDSEGESDPRAVSRLLRALASKKRERSLTDTPSSSDDTSDIEKERNKRGRYVSAEEETKSPVLDINLPGAADRGESYAVELSLPALSGFEDVSISRNMEDELLTVEVRSQHRDDATGTMSLHVTCKTVVWPVDGDDEAMRVTFDQHQRMLTLWIGKKQLKEKEKENEEIEMGEEVYVLSDCEDSVSESDSDCESLASDCEDEEDSEGGCRHHSFDCT